MGFIFGATNPSYNAAAGLPGFIQNSTIEGLNHGNAMTMDALGQQQAFVNALGGANGLNPLQAGVFGQQQALANQYQNMANGQGPNPAKAQLAETTGQNVQQTGALMNSARGAQSNPGLMARQAGQAGANAQQQAVGQAATMGAQQQLAGLQGMAAQQGSMANLATAGVGQQQNALSQLGSQNLAYQQMLQNAMTQQNAQQVAAQSANVPLYQQAMKGSQGILGGVMNAVGGLLGLSEGGTVPNSPNQAQSIFGAYSQGLSAGGKIDGKAEVKGDSRKNDTVPAMLSPGEVVIPRSSVGSPDKAAQFLNGLMGWNLKAGKA